VSTLARDSVNSSQVQDFIKNKVEKKNNIFKADLLNFIKISVLQHFDTLLDIQKTKTVIQNKNSQFVIILFYDKFQLMK